jgi:hypothetical protein
MSKEPDNYRAITLVDCLKKLFTAIINNRLSLLPDEINLISECQTGFRKGYSTIDNIFSLHAHISLYFSLGKNIPCLTPVKRWERSENRFWLQAQDFIFLCLFLIKSKHFPWIPNFCISDEKILMGSNC